jgi:hypothetical protein
LLRELSRGRITQGKADIMCLGILQFPTRNCEKEPLLRRGRRRAVVEEASEFQGREMMKRRIESGEESLA